MTNLAVDRFYYPYWEWEESSTSMWGTKKDREKYLQKAIEFTGDAELYGKWMLEVVGQWPKSCAHNLSNVTQNRRAWIGHAACALAFDCPEDIVRQAWGNLTEPQQIAANKKADEAITEWENAQNKIRHECSRCREMAYRKNLRVI